MNPSEVIQEIKSILADMKKLAIELDHRREIREQEDSGYVKA